MIPLNDYIIFSIPSSPRELLTPIHAPRKCKFQCGNYNRKLVKDILLFNGVQQAKDDKFSVYWGNYSETKSHEAKNPLFRFNHFPNSKNVLGNKAEFARSIQKNPAYHMFPRFMPYTYVLPKDKELLFKAMKEHPRSYYIVKPPNGSCGNGIRLVTYSEFFYIPPNSVVSEYISKPLCIDSFKFDLRVYVLVTSFAPLRAFVYKEGLARFATESYSPVAGSVFSHLTNATLNKKSSNWENGAFKWKLSELVLEISHRWRQPQSMLMEQIFSTVAKTLAFVQPLMSPTERKRLVDPYFELFGFDIIFDRNFTPYILEVNCMPSLNTQEDVDFEIKTALLAQALSIVGIPDLTVDELNNIYQNYKMAPGGIKQFDDEIVRHEDERNKLSGDGFIRIFPSNSDVYSRLIFTPPLRLGNSIDIIVGQKPQTLPNLFPHHAVTTEQGLVILVFYLTKLEHKLRVAHDSQLSSRVQCFLLAQGYKLSRGVAGIRAILLHFINKLKNWTNTSKVALPNELREEVSSANEEWFKKTLTACDLPMVNNIRLLFK